MRRLFVPPTVVDYDSRAYILGVQVREEWDEEIRRNWEQSQEHVRRSIVADYGTARIEEKGEDFREFGPLPFSIISYHSALLRQIRDAFVVGAYYPALTGACAAGERILNHLLIDLRSSFMGTNEYKRVHKKDSIDSWSEAIRILSAWKVLLPGAAGALTKLSALRNKSIHFSMETYPNLRSDALQAAHLLISVVRTQFNAGAEGGAPWFVAGTRGSFFVRKEFEANPFIRRYYAPVCPAVSPYFALAFGEERWVLFDKRSAAEAPEVSDEEFARLFDERKPEDLASTEEPAGSDVIVYRWR